jgi:hypothetical protein
MRSGSRSGDLVQMDADRPYYARPLSGVGWLIPPGFLEADEGRMSAPEMPIRAAVQRWASRQQWRHIVG